MSTVMLMLLAVLAANAPGAQPTPARSPGQGALAQAVTAPAGPATPAVPIADASRPARARRDPVTPIADASLGLAKGSVFDVPTPPAVKPNATAPGERPLLPRAWVGAPARIPHGVEDFLPITRAQNPCLDCHGVKEKKAGEPTPIPPSHYTDYRNAPGRPGTEVVGARAVCTACHVPTTDAPGLVENRFRP